jgi:hypothetical protein
MQDLQEIKTYRDMDHLRLLGISRIPRCADCPRLPVLAAAVRRSSGSAAPLPEARDDCRHEVCRPLISRYFPTGRSCARPLRLVEAGGGCC